MPCYKEKSFGLAKTHILTGWLMRLNLAQRILAVKMESNLGDFSSEMIR